MRPPRSRRATHPDQALYHPDAGPRGTDAGRCVVTRWGLVLLVLFIVLGLVGMPTGRATRVAVWSTAVLLLAVWVVAWR